MSRPHAIEQEIDFDAQMKSFAEEADQIRDHPLEQKLQRKLAELLGPIVTAIDALTRNAKDNSAVLQKLEEAAAAKTDLPAVLSTLREDLDQKNRLNQKQFDALHEELRSYKDDFLLHVFHKPIVRDLITLFDDLSALHRQTNVVLARNQTGAGMDPAHLKKFTTNLDHIVHSLLEILSRMEVQRLEPSTGKLDIQRQRAVSVEAAATSEEDHTIVASLKPGFLWRARLLRPEEVIIKKWREANGPSLPPQK